MDIPKIKQNGKLRSLIYEVRSFLPDPYSDETSELLKPLVTALCDHNEFSMSANLCTAHFEFDSIYLPDYNAGEDYEPGGSWRNDYLDEWCHDSEELEDKKSEAQDLVWKLEEEVAAIDATLESLTDEEKDDTDEYAKWADALEVAEAKRDEAQMVLDDWEDAEWQEDELMWNTAWSEHGRINEHLARSLGLDTLTFISEAKEGDQYFSLGGIGMDMSPKLAAYVILDHGFCPSEYASHFESELRFRYFWDVASPATTVECLVEMDVLDIALHNGYFTDEEIDRYKIRDRIAEMGNSDKG